MKKPKLPPGPPPPPTTPTRADAMFGQAGTSNPQVRPTQSAINTSSSGVTTRSNTSRRTLIGGA